MLGGVITDPAQFTTMTVVLRLFLAAVCGGLIGLERGKKRRPAGLRTHILVCIGSALTMMIGQYVYLFLDAGSEIGRLGAQVVSGIGFLGAGTIIVTGRLQVKGLTTAAGLWASACMGLAIGIGFYVAALVACALILFVIMILHPFDERMQARSRVYHVCVELESAHAMLAFVAKLREQERKLSDVQVLSRESDASQGVVITFALHLEKRVHHADLIVELGAMEGVLAVEEL